MRFVQTVIILISVLFVLPAFAQEPNFDRDVLRSIDTVPTRAQLDSTFEDPAALLREAALDESHTTYERHRAISLLSFYPDEQTRSFLEGLATSENAEVARMAIYTLARTYGPVADAQLVQRVASHTKSDDAVVREWAVRGLRWMAHPDAAKALKRVAASSDEKLARIAERALSKRAGAEQVR